VLKDELSSRERHRQYVDKSAMNRESNITTLRDGRRLAYSEYGDPKGMPVIYCHGFPGSRLEALLIDQQACEYNLRVIAPDRNGLGLSDPKPGRRLLDWALDVEALVDIMGIDRFFLIGISGGGPYAIACAYRLADRVDGFTLVCPLGPLDQPGLLNAMRWPAQINFRSMKMTPWLSRFVFRFGLIPLAQLSPQWIYQAMLSIAPRQDSTVLSLPPIRAAITASLSEAVRQGADGVLKEMAIYTRPWGFDLSGITLPVQLWHGTADEIVPLLHALTLAERLPNCTTHFLEGEGHFSLPIEKMSEILDQLITSRAAQQPEESS
jgi:pimeloyl-ACP methyl ester carboxylesterase